MTEAKCIRREKQKKCDTVNNILLAMFTVLV